MHAPNFIAYEVSKFCGIQPKTISLLRVQMNRAEMLIAIAAYYESIGRVKTPQYESYSLNELKKCIVLFKLRIPEKN